MTEPAGETRWPRRALPWVAALATLAVAWGLVAGRALIQTDAIGHPDVVFSLSGDPLGDRVEAAIEVASSSDATRLVFFLDGGSVPRTPAQIRRQAVRMGVPDDAIRFLDGVGSTADEAGLAAGLVERCAWSDAVVVTSSFHTRRAAWTFERAIGDAANVAVTAAADDFDAEAWWSTEGDRRDVLHEWPKAIGSLWFLARPPEPIESSVPC